MSDATSVFMWTVTKHPSDFPDKYVARKARILRGSVEVTATVVVHKELEVVRNELLRRGLIALPPREGDDPVIVETWI